MTKGNSNKIYYSVNEQRDTEIVVGYNLRNYISKELSKKKTNFFIIDKVIYKLHYSYLFDLKKNSTSDVFFIQIEGGEKAKSLELFQEIIHDLIRLKIKKSDVIIAVGGGTICDLSAFISQNLYRGIKLKMIPTTLLSQVDASIGSKNGLNFLKRKNILGNFYFPDKVYIDIEFLKTLSPDLISAGFAEIIKVFTIADPNSFMLLNKVTIDEDFLGKKKEIIDIINKSIKTKIKLLKHDPFESNSKRLLNFGHAFAHPIEEVSNFQLSHGEAVLISMVLETSISLKIKHISIEDFTLIISVIKRFYTPACKSFRCDVKSLLKSVKEIRLLRAGNLNLVTPTSIGNGVIIEDINDNIIKDVLNSYFRN